jgi:hypothetical protein
MPNIFTNITIASPLTSHNALDAAVVAATPKQIKFVALVLNLPFGKRGSTTIRAQAKQYGARWDGNEWTLPSHQYTPPSLALDWFRENDLIQAIKVRQYQPFVWDGDNSQHLALDIPFAERLTAKNQGAKWEPQFSRWYLPAGQITQSRVDALNAAEAIAGYMNAHGVIGAAPVQPAPTSGSPARQAHPIAAKIAATMGKPVPAGELPGSDLLRLFAEQARAYSAVQRDASDGRTEEQGLLHLLTLAQEPRRGCNRYWLRLVEPAGGLVVCFSEVPHADADGKHALMVLAWRLRDDLHLTMRPEEAFPNHLDTPANLYGYADTTQMLHRRDAHALYERLANHLTHPFKPYQAP